MGYIGELWRSKMPPVNDSNNIPGSAGPLVNGSAGNSSNDNDKTPTRKFTFPSHQFHMVHLAKMCQENKEYTDRVIRVGNADGGGGQQDQELRAHRLVLGSVSPFLKLVFADLPQNHTEATILVPGVHKRVVKALLDFFYTGQMTVEREDTSDLQLLIDTLQIDPGLITVDTVSQVESNPDPKTEKSETEINTKSETDDTSKTKAEKDVTTKTTNQQNEKSSLQPTPQPEPETSTENEVVEVQKQKNEEGVENNFFDRLIDRKRKANENDDFDISTPSDKKNKSF